VIIYSYNLADNCGATVGLTYLESITDKVYFFLNQLILNQL